MGPTEGAGGASRGGAGRPLLTVPKRLRIACCLSVLAEVFAVEALAIESGDATASGILEGGCAADVGDWRPLNKDSMSFEP